jgi:hypothetical protein
MVEIKGNVTPSKDNQMYISGKSFREIAGIIPVMIHSRMGCDDRIVLQKCFITDIRALQDSSPFNGVNLQCFE